MDRIPGPVIAGVALAGYGFTLSEGASPGASSALLVSNLGLFPRLSPISPVWSLLARGVATVAGEHAVAALNALSALCAAVAVALLYSLMRQGVFFFTDAYAITAGRRRVAAVLAGGAAALCLAFCIPFWAVANRAHPMAFDVLLVLLLARLFVAYAEAGQRGAIWGFALLYGIGVAEFATLIVLGPVFGLALLFVMWKREALRPGRVAGVAVAFMLGLTMYGVAAWDFHETPGYVLRGYGSFGQVLRHMWRDQFFLIARSLPREGWLVVLIVTVAPWATMFATARRALNDERDWGIYILHALMTVLVVAVVLNTPLAPWAMLGWHRLLVTPYVLTAMVFGYLVAFWFLLSGDRRDAEFGLNLSLLRLLAGWAGLLALLGLALWVPWHNAPHASTRESRPVNALADSVVESLDGRTWLITDGMLDHHLLLAARRQGVPLRLVNMMAGGSALYLDYVAEYFEDIRLKNLAKLSLPALLREWLKPDGGAYGDVAALAYPDLWQQFGLVSVPHRLVFFGTDTGEVDAEALIRSHERFWPEFDAWLTETEDADRWTRWARGRAGMAANELGVLLEDQAHDTAAFRAYQTARRLDADNVSALLNMIAMVNSGRAEDPQGEVAAALRTLEEGLEQKYQIWMLSQLYGTVRSPEAFAQLGWTWAYSGRPGLALAQMERAVALMPDEPTTRMQGLMADLLVMDNRPLESETLYKALLLEDAGDVHALQGLMRLALRRQDYEAAETYRLQAAQSGLAPVQAVLLQALIETVSGQYAVARERMEQLLQDDRRLLHGWVLLAEIGFAVQDERLLDQALRRLEGIEGARGLHGAVIRARRALGRNDLAAAADFFEMALLQRPGERRMIEMLLRLDLSLGRAGSIRRHVLTLLQEDPGHALALYVRGSLQIAAGEHALAEDSLRRSLHRERLPMALNDLAWLLQARGAYDEAEALVNEALSISEKQPAAWDTKGVILLRTGRTAEAEAALGRALALTDNNPTVHLHMGEVQLALGKIEPLRRIVEMIEPHRERLPEREREIFNRLREAVQ